MDQGLSRRNFFKLSAVAGAGALGAATLASCAPNAAGPTAEEPTSVGNIAWDGCYDVIVAGFGAAGASTAIAAAEAGANVLLVDKAPEGHEGGNSRFCAQLFVSIEDVDKGIEHYKAQRGSFSTPSDDVIKAYVEGMHNIKATLGSWGLDESRIVDFTHGKVPNLVVEYPELPGSDAVRTNLIDGAISQSTLWRFLKSCVNDRKDKIDCWYESPAKELIQDPATKAVIGVRINRAGKTVNIAAKNGVVLTCGGFENSPEYHQTYLGYPVAYPMGTQYNEGDGLTMTQAIGARMWHISSWESNGAGLGTQADRVRVAEGQQFFNKGSVMLVGGDGRRYVAEDLEQRHGHVLIGGTWMIPRRPEKNFFIMDAAHLQDTSLMPWGPRPYRNWSMGCVDEISSGKLVEASTLADLAIRIGVEADVLERSVQMFNAAAESGEDAYGREAATMTAFGEGPYYAFEVFPSILNTQGGAERTAQGEIVGVDGKPIPHLYSAGEFGGVNSNKYQGGSNIAECIVFGKISGEHAAVAKDDVQLDIDEQSVEYKIGSGDVSAYQQTPDESALSTGEVYGIGEGLGGPIWVKAAGSDGAITALEIVRATETEGVGTAAYEPVVAAIVESGGVDVDTVSGATMTSKGIIEAAGDALSKL